MDMNKVADFFKTYWVTFLIGLICLVIGNATAVCK